MTYTPPSTALRGALTLTALAASALLGLAAAPACAQTVISEDFSEYAATGGPVASTDYTLINQGVFTNPAQYRVVADPAAPTFTNGYSSYFDHTTGTASGAMLFFDGAGDGTSRIWYQQATLTAGTPYAISFWGSAADGSNVPTLNFLVDGAQLGATLTTVNATFTQFTATYTPTVTGPHTFAIVDTNTPAGGNDGALDDILVAGPAPEPSAFAGLALGALGLGTLTLRARSRRSA